MGLCYLADLGKAGIPKKLLFAINKATTSIFWEKIKQKVATIFVKFCILFFLCVFVIFFSFFSEYFHWPSQSSILHVFCAKFLSFEKKIVLLQVWCPPNLWLCRPLLTYERFHLKHKLLIFCKYPTWRLTLSVLPAI